MSRRPYRTARRPRRSGDLGEQADSEAINYATVMWMATRTAPRASVVPLPSGNPDPQVDDAAAAEAVIRPLIADVVRAASLMALDHRHDLKGFDSALRSYLTKELGALAPALAAAEREMRRKGALDAKRAPTASEIALVTEYQLLPPPGSSKLTAVQEALGRKPGDQRKPNRRFAEARKDLQRRLMTLRARLLDLPPDPGTVAFPGIPAILARPKRERVQQQIEYVRSLWDVANRPTARLIELSERVQAHLHAQESAAAPEWWDDPDSPMSPNDDPYNPGD